MKYALLADIHANLSALRAVLKDMAEQRCTHAACLGDIVGYNWEPKECLDIIREMEIPCVKGNHDAYCSEEIFPDEFNPQALERVEWTRCQLTAEDRAWLRGLQYVEPVAGFTIVHASLDAPERWGYVFDRIAAAAHFTHQRTPVCFFGHTHVPVAFTREKGLLRAPVVRGGTFSKFKVERGRRYFVNCGSIGQPRDGDHRAAYVTYDLDERMIELRRVAFEASADSSGSAPVPVAPNRPRPVVARNAQSTSTLNHDDTDLE